MAGVGFLQSLWEKPTWEGVWSYLDPMDFVCLRTAAMEWNVPGGYGPHGELFFFLIQKETATMPGSETFSPVINADTCVTSSLLMSSRSARLSPCTFLRKEETEMDVMSLVWGTNGKWIAQRAQCGRVKAKLGRKTKVCPLVALVTAMWETTRCTSLGCMGLVTRSLFSWRIGGWQRLALSCHMALDMLCQEMNEAWLWVMLLRGLLSRRECSLLTVDGT